MAMTFQHRILATGLINETQLELAVSEQLRRGVSMSRVLLDLGLIAPEKLADFVAQEARTRRVDLMRFPPDRVAVGLVPLETARRLRALPIESKDGLLVVAMTDPFDIAAIDALGQLSGLHIEVVTATERDILNTIDQLKSEGPSIQDSIARVIEDSEQDRTPDQIQSALSADGVEANPDDAPIIQLVSQVLTRAIHRRASDVHFEPEEKLMRIRTRIDGVLHPDVLIPKALQSAVVARLKIMAEMDVAETRIPQDGRASLTVNRRKVNLRVSSLPTNFGESMVLRILDPMSQLGSIAALGLSPAVEAEVRVVTDAPYGVVIVTGPTGSGKTTTLYAVLNEINKPDVSIFTLEDPVEFPLRGIRQTQVKEEVGLTFSTSLRALLRQDPDIILVGETRDTETATLMVRAALTGHLVFSTLHTNDAAGAVPRLTDMGVEPYLLPGALLGVLAQRLVRKLCPKCKVPVADPEFVFRAAKLPIPDTGIPMLLEPKGCADCQGVGYRGRLAIFELMRLDERYHNAMISRGGSRELQRIAIEAGMKTMFDDGLRRCAEGLTSLSELLRVVNSH
jgi:type IV pilus assembly protein PilB